MKDFTEDQHNRHLCFDEQVHRLSGLRVETYAMTHMQDAFLLQIGYLAISDGAERKVICCWQKKCPNSQAEKRRINLCRGWVRFSIFQFESIKGCGGSLGSKPCSEKRSPPAKKHSPRTSTTTCEKQAEAGI